jgi:hypothetical protein
MVRAHATAVSGELAGEADEVARREHFGGQRTCSSQGRCLIGVGTRHNSVVGDGERADSADTSWSEATERTHVDRAW